MIIDILVAHRSSKIQMSGLFLSLFLPPFHEWERGKGKVGHVLNVAQSCEGIWQWQLMRLSYDRAGARIIMGLVRRQSVSFSTATQPLQFSVYNRVKFSHIMSIVIWSTQHNTANTLNIHLFITYTTCFGQQLWPSSGDITTIQR